MVGTTLPAGGCFGVCMSVNRNTFQPLLALSYSVGADGVVGGRRNVWRMGSCWEDYKGISPVESLVPGKSETMEGQRCGGGGLMVET